MAGVGKVDIMLETNRKCLSGDPVYLGRLIPDSGKLHQNQEVWAEWGGSCTLKATHYKDPVKVLIVASRGRNQDKPTSRIAGLPTEQRLEIQRGGYTNTLTSVQKDNLVLEVRNE